jgi:hypothetical protein
VIEKIQQEKYLGEGCNSGDGQRREGELDNRFQIEETSFDGRNFYYS